MHRFGHNIKRLRKQKGMTQAELAKRIGKDSSYISKLENNETKGNFETLSDIARALDVSIYELLGKDEQHTTREVG